MANNALVIASTKGRPVPIEDTYKLVFPYQHLNEEVQRSIAERAECVYHIKEVIESVSDYDYFDSVMFSLGYIQDNFPVNFKESEFVDCIGHCGAASFYAASFDFLSIIGIEFSTEGFQYAQQIQSELFAEVQSLSRLKFEYGSFQDFFSFHAKVVFCDCSTVGMDSMIDEGVLLKTMLFPMCCKMLSSTFLVIVTSSVNLTTADCSTMGFNFSCEYSKVITPQHKTHSSILKDCFPRKLWILRSCWNGKK
jgi:hypothetical protein